MNRRHLIRFCTSLIVLSSPLRELFARETALPKTPWDYEGPFYPIGERQRTNQLITGKPRSDVLLLSGHTVQTEGRAEPNLRVEIWQTDGLGRYKHPRDRREGKRWEEFLYWGETMTQTDGSFTFKTYLPAAYHGRPAHIHYKVWRKNALLLTSQFYFDKTGGAKGASKSPSLSVLQTLSLTQEKEGVFEANARVVV